MPTNDRRTASRSRRGSRLVALCAAALTALATAALIGPASADPPTSVGATIPCLPDDTWSWCIDGDEIAEVEVEGIWGPGEEVIVTMTPNLPYCQTSDGSTWTPNDCIAGYRFNNPALDGISDRICAYFNESDVLRGDFSRLVTNTCDSLYSSLPTAIPTIPATVVPDPCRTAADFQFFTGAPAPATWAEVAPANQICTITVSTDYVRHDALPGPTWRFGDVQFERCQTGSGCSVEFVGFVVPVDGDLVPDLSETLALLDENGDPLPEDADLADFPVYVGETFILRRTITVNQGSDLSQVTIPAPNLSVFAAVQLIGTDPVTPPTSLTRATSTIIDYEFEAVAQRTSEFINFSISEGFDDNGIRRRGDFLSADVLIRDRYDRDAAPGDPVAFELLETACVALDTGGIVGGQAITFGVATGSTGTPCADVPSTATAVYANVIVEGPSREGNLRLTAAGTVPSGGIVNFGANGLENSNAQSVPLSADGALELSVNGGPTGVGQQVADGVIVEILGWYGPDATLGYVPVDPCAVFETRTTQGGTGTITSDTTRMIDIAGSIPASQSGGPTDCGVPADAVGALVNVVALDTDTAMTISSGTTGATIVSNIDLGVPMANSNAVPLPIDSGSIELDIDIDGANAEARAVVLGYFTVAFDAVGTLIDAGALGYVPLPPCALFDTRSQPPLQGGISASFTILGERQASIDPDPDCGIPLGVDAVELNVIAVNAVRQGNLRIGPTRFAAQGGSLTFAPLIPKMNNSSAIVMGTLGREIFIEANGGPSGFFQPVTPVRAVATGYWVPFE